jgi:hypothetical protein
MQTKIRRVNGLLFSTEYIKSLYCTLYMLYGLTKFNKRREVILKRGGGDEVRVGRLAVYFIDRQSRGSQRDVVYLG